MRFVVFRSKQDGQWYFKIQSANSKIISQSEGYKRKGGAFNAIYRIRAKAAASSIVVRA